MIQKFFVSGLHPKVISQNSKDTPDWEVVIFSLPCILVGCDRA